MDLAVFLARLNTQPLLNGKVGLGMPGAMESLDAAPYAWITGAMESGSLSPVTGPVRQRIEVRLEVAVGGRELAEVQAARDAVRSALVNYAPTTDYAPMVLVKGVLDAAEPGWLQWRDEFNTDYYLTG